MTSNRKTSPGRPRLSPLEKARRAAKRAKLKVDEAKAILDAAGGEFDAKEKQRVGRPQATAQTDYNTAVRTFDKKVVAMKALEADLGESPVDLDAVEDPYEETTAGRPSSDPALVEIDRIDRNKRLAERQLARLYVQDNREREESRIFEDQGGGCIAGTMGRPQKSTEEKVKRLTDRIESFAAQIALLELDLDEVSKAKRKLDKLRHKKRTLVADAKNMKGLLSLSIETEEGNEKLRGMQADIDILNRAIKEKENIFARIKELKNILSSGEGDIEKISELQRLTSDK